MPRQLLNEYLNPEDITPDMLDGAVDEITPKQRRIFDFVSPESHDTDKVEYDVVIEQFNQSANIVGFSDSSIMIQGLKTERRLVTPFHVKNAYPFSINDRDGIVRRGGPDGFQIDLAGIAYATAYLEEARMNLMANALMSCVNDKQFTYIDGKLKITVPYTREILDLTTPSTKYNAGASFDLLDEWQKTKQEFYENSGLIPDTIFVNPAMGRVIVADPDVRAAYRASQSSDPDNTARTWESFNYNGININILHDKYPDLTGTLQSAVADERIIWMASNVMASDGGLPGAGGPEVGRPLRLHRCSNILNANRPTRPYYDSYEVSKDPWSHAVRLYDNMIPGIYKIGVIQHQDNCLS